MVHLVTMFEVWWSPCSYNVSYMSSSCYEGQYVPVQNQYNLKEHPHDAICLSTKTINYNPMPNYFSPTPNVYPHFQFSVGACNLTLLCHFVFIKTREIKSHKFVSNGISFCSNVYMYSQEFDRKSVQLPYMASIPAIWIGCRRQSAVNMLSRYLTWSQSRC